jgi:hypothetical protein
MEIENRVLKRIFRNKRAEATDDGDTWILRSFINPILHIILLE